MQTTHLSGISGDHLWGFLTSIGILTLVDKHAQTNGHETPTLHFENDGTASLRSAVGEADLALVAFENLQAIRPCFESSFAGIKKPTDFTTATYAAIAEDGKRTRAELDILAGLACCVGGETFESTLCAANGASHQNLVQSIRDVLCLVQKEHIHDALFVPWTRNYRVPDALRKRFDLGTRKPSLRFDPNDERLYALRRTNPTTADDFKTELGAQALAITAFGLLPVVPQRRPVTVASVRKRERALFFWALWNVPATLNSVRSFVWGGNGEPKELRARGAFHAFCAARVSGAKGKLSFAPTVGVW